MSSDLAWRISSFTGTGANCVAVAEAGPQLAIRNSNHPDDGTITVERSVFGALLDSIKLGEQDDLGL